ncbi:MAG: tRNA (N6-threonylcarbamoyladenosine(37)-N6)-methyltransferase TrmO [Bryobacterales bacterium]|nr:tRNA (N6-threonylcarbamoyladenosine(37)-N6)-methyltransferase TrmO [Bryobacteraceae bacterium]MDW8353643.1 tRNA (N6-threonylcarbamoyladenosine(37)-N6)-methyltransferase TrmO [Bryobacterales bacterium]
MPEPFQLKKIGTVRCPVREREDMPAFGVPASIELVAEYRDGLLHLEKHSHIWVMAWLEGTERDVLQVTPRGVAEQAPDALHGVFAVRSPARPNPIGLTAAKIVRIGHGVIEVDALDFLDGTPVVDLKPYFVTHDMIFSAVNAPIGKPSSREAMRESLRRQALRFHGEACPDLELAVSVVERFRAEVLALGEPEAWQLTAPLDRPCLVDALMGMTRATPGRRTLRLVQTDSVRFEHGGRSYRYALPRTNL